MGISRTDLPQGHLSTSSPRPRDSFHFFFCIFSKEDFLRWKKDKINARGRHCLLAVAFDHDFLCLSLGAIRNGRFSAFHEDRSNKPIMEKRRRARINNCLNELKTLILDATKKDPARHSKLEKADILEKTVKYLQDLQRQQAVMSQATDPKVVNKFKAGFTECANEVSRFPGIDPVVKRRLLQHLSNCINGVKTADLHHSAPSPQTVVPSVQVHMLPSPPSSPEQDQQMHSVPNQAAALHPNGYFLSNGLQVIPTKLQNGSYALVVPHSVPQSAQIPTLVPIPSRTSSTSSAASAPCSIYERMTSGSPAAAYTPPSPATSYEMMDCKPSVIQHGSSSSSPHLHYAHVPQSYSPSPAPLSLVIKKERDEDQPWRPW